jgi:hypothetical protein
VAQPQPYSRTTDFAQRDGNDTDHNAINQEFDGAALTIGQLRACLALIQRDDGALQNGIVTAESLAPSATEALHSAVEAFVTLAQQASESALTSASVANLAMDNAAASAGLAATAQVATAANAVIAVNASGAATNAKNAAASSASNAASSEAQALLNAQTGPSMVALAAPNGSTLLGRPVGTVGSKLDEIPSLRDKGGISDYVGTPLYDGADAGRITATDNTTAFNALINAAIAAGHSAVKIPAGHWAIKVGNLSFANFDKLRIFGDGIGVTILDFLKEDTSRIAYVDNISSPNVIASFTTGNSIEFADMTISATTKAGVVNGSSGPANAAAVYYGGVWGFKLNNVKDVRFTRVRAEHFNYRSFSVYGPATERVTMMHCEGFYNVGSGFWVQDAAVFKVIGGEYAYNGIRGENGTGYGVTASANVGKYIVDRPYCHHNYRKGIDSHGCAQYIVKGGTFENNVLYHLANPNWAPPAGVSDCAVIVKGNTFSNGKLPADRAWLLSCYQALAANGYGASDATCIIMGIYDNTNGGATIDKMKSILIEDNTVICHYNGGGDAGLTTSAKAIDILSITAKTVFKGNNFNFELMGFPANSQIYSQMVMSVNCPSVRLDGNMIEVPTPMAYTNSTSTTADRGALLGLITSANPMALELHNNRFKLNNCYFITATGAGVRNPVQFNVAGAKRLFTGNTWDYTDDPYKDTNGLNNAYFLGLESSANAAMYSKGNTFLRNGFAYQMPDGPLNRTTGALAWVAAGINKAIGADVLSVVLDKQYATSLRISTNDGSPDLFILIPFSSYAGLTASAGNSLLSYSSVDAAFIENGVTKLKVTVKAKVAMVGDFWGRVVVDGIRPSLGIERVITL